MRNPDKPDKPKKSRLGKLTLQKDIFDNALRDNLKSTVDIVALFAHFGVQLTKKRKSYVGLCPWHDDSTPSLSVDKTKGLYNCFGCGESGDIFTLVEKMQGCTFSEAMEFLQHLGGLPFSPAKREADDGSTSRQARYDASLANRTDGEKQALTSKATQAVVESPSQKEVPAKAEEKRPPSPKSAPEKSSITLDDVQNYYAKKLIEHTDALSYLQKRGITNETISYFRIGFADGTLTNTVGKSGFKALQEKGIFTDKKYELMKGCITVPLQDIDGRVLSFYGRRIDATSKMPSHLYLSGDHVAVLHEKAYQVYDAIILTESVIDALSLFTAGIQNVSCIYGTNGLTPLHLAKLHEHAVKEVVLALDTDEAGKKAVEKYTEVLVNEGFAVKAIFPEGRTPSGTSASSATVEVKDWNELLSSGCLKKEDVLSSIDTAEAVKPEPTGRSFRKTDSGLVLTHDDMTYTVKQDSSSRLSVKCEMDGEVFYDRVDLVSSRSRSSFAGNVSRIFDTETKRIEKDLIALLEYLEEEKETGVHEEDEEIILSEEDKALGMSFLTNPDMFEEIVKDTETLGYVGEETNKKLMYLAATSRLLDDPISILILSESGSGKSYLVDTIKKLMPPEDVIDVTSLSDQALNYMGDLEHKFMSLSEAVHKDVIEHQLREMVSKKELSRLVTRKNEKTGTMKTEQVKVKAVVSLVMSSTNYNVNPENASRSFLMYADESDEQTGRIYAQQTMKRSFEKQKIRKQLEPEVIQKHHAAQRMLQSYMVVSHFDTGLFFPKSMMRFRRDHDRFVDLIAAVCFLRQYQKDVKEKDGMLYIECDDTDYDTARELLIEGVLAQALLELPKGAVKVYEAFRKLVHKRAQKRNISPVDVEVSQRELREYTGFGHSSLKQHIRLLVEYEYLLKHGSGMRGSRSYYTLRKDEPISRVKELSIPTAAEYRKKLNNPDENI